jgi:hypothetical protein
MFKRCVYGSEEAPPADRFLCSRVAGRWILQWPKRSIPFSEFERVNTTVLNSSDYSSITRTRAVKLYNECKEEHVSMHKSCTREKIIKNHARMNMKVGKIAAAYAAGGDILDLAARFDFPPVSLLRGILILKYGSSLIYSMFAEKASPAGLDPRDRAQYARACAADADSVIAQKTSSEIADANEALFVEWIRGLGIKLKTQSDLIAEGSKLTPDVLFVDHVEINGEPVRWIDYKDYAGTPVSFLRKSNAKQAAKYQDAFGPGMMCYRLGPVEGLRIGCSLLSAGSLPVEWRGEVCRGKKNI